MKKINYWVMKSEPSCFSIDDLARKKNQTDSWDGVRNYQVRNWIRDVMQIGDLAFFYHSSCETPGIVGVMEIVSQAYPDETAFNPNDHHYDPKSTPENPRWYYVNVRLREKFKQVITLNQMRSNPHLKNLKLLQKGNRLSITPLSSVEWREINSLK